MNLDRSCARNQKILPKLLQVMLRRRRKRGAAGLERNTPDLGTDHARNLLSRFKGRGSRRNRVCARRRLLSQIAVVRSVLHLRNRRNAWHQVWILFGYDIPECLVGRAEKVGRTGDETERVKAVGQIACIGSAKAYLLARLIRLDNPFIVLLPNSWRRILSRCRPSRLLGPPYEEPPTKP